MHALFVLSGWAVSTLVATVHSGFVRRFREADRTDALCATPGPTVDPLAGEGLPGFVPVRRGEVREPAVLARGAVDPFAVVVPSAFVRLCEGTALEPAVVTGPSGFVHARGEVRRTVATSG